MALHYQHWQEMEKDQLGMAYRLNVPLKVMAAFFGRSPTAVNKALGRFRIRPRGVFQRGVKKGSSRSTYVTLKDFSALMKAYSLKAFPNRTSNCDLHVRHHQGLNFQKGGCHSQGKISEAVAESLAFKTIMEARFDSPFAALALPELDADEVERQNVLAQARPWLSLEALIEKLRSYDVNVLIFKFQSPETSESYRFLMNGLSVSAAELLVKANKLFLAQGESTVYVDEITL